MLMHPAMGLTVKALVLLLSLMVCAGCERTGFCTPCDQTISQMDNFFDGRSGRPAYAEPAGTPVEYGSGYAPAYPPYDPTPPITDRASATPTSANHPWKARGMSSSAK
jgi:hypothetical protein